MSVELVERESNGDGHLRGAEVEEDVVVVEVEVDEEEGEGDMYLEETCLPLGFLGRTPLFFSEGKRGGRDGFCGCWSCW